MRFKIWCCITWLWTVLCWLWLQHLETCWLPVPAPGWGNQTCLVLTCVRDEGCVFTLSKQQGKPLPHCTVGLPPATAFLFLELGSLMYLSSEEEKFPNSAILVGYMGALCFQLLSTSIIAANASLCYPVKTEYSASDSCWCSSVCEYSLSSALPSNCFHLGATALNLVGF